MPDMTTIGAAITSLRLLKDVAQTMVGLRDAQAFQAKLIEFNTALMDAQASVFSVNEERTALIEKVRDLETKVMKLEAWEAQRERYKLETLPPGVFVLTLKPEMAEGEPPHHICQTCYQRGTKSILHSDQYHNGIHHLTCHECDTKLQVGHFVAPRVDRGRGGDGTSWMGS